MSQQDAIITGLRDVLGKEEGLAELLEQSLVNARKSAEAELNADLFEALDWPEDIGQYEEYLKGFLRWLPRQSDAKAWGEWTPTSGTPRRSATGSRTSFSWSIRTVGAARPRIPAPSGTG
ncbi:hypothetical protein [Mycobacterium sp. HUMS_1102779]